MGNVPTHLYPLKDYSQDSKGLLLLDQNNLSLLEKFDLAALKQHYYISLFHGWWYDRLIEPEERHFNYFFHQLDDGKPVRFDTEFTVRDAYAIADLAWCMCPNVMAKLDDDSGMDWSAKTILLGATNLVDETYWTPSDTPKVYDFVLSATTFSRRKNFLYALQVIDRIYRSPRAQGVFSGRIALAYCKVDEDYFAEAMRFAADRGLHIDHVFDPSMSELRELYQKSRACFHPSLADGAARVINECLCCGVPVIQLDCEWARENWVLPGNPGVFFDRDGDPDAILDWLATMDADFVRRHRIPDIHATYAWFDDVMARRFDDWERGRLIMNPQFGKAKLYEQSDEFATALERMLQFADDRNAHGAGEAVIEAMAPVRQSLQPAQPAGLAASPSARE